MREGGAIYIYIYILGEEYIEAEQLGERVRGGMGTGYVDSLLVSRRSAVTLCGTNTTDNADLDPQTDPQE